MHEENVKPDATASADAPARAEEPKVQAPGQSPLAKEMRRRRRFEKPTYGIGVEEFLRRERDKAEQRAKLAGYTIRKYEDVAHDAQSRPGASYGGNDS